jgi:hypothetical protein
LGKFCFLIACDNFSGDLEARTRLRPLAGILSEENNMAGDTSASQLENPPVLCRTIRQERPAGNLQF